MPWWFQTLASVLAVVLSVWAGLHYGRADASLWMGAYGAAALVSAALPTQRLVGLAGLAVAGGIGAVGAYLLGDAVRAVTLDHLWASREVLALGITVAWLAVGSLFRLVRA